jgi:hypothetical protein
MVAVDAAPNLINRTRELLTHFFDHPRCIFRTAAERDELILQRDFMLHPMWERKDEITRNGNGFSKLFPS